jgi:anti-anti-sigma factor
MDFQLEPTTVKGEYKVSIGGNFTIYLLEKWKKFILENIQSIDTLILDLKHLKEIDSAGIQALLITKNYFRRLKKNFILIHHPACIISHLDLFWLVGFMEDKISISKKDKEIYKFSYGIKKLPKVLKKWI